MITPRNYQVPPIRAIFDYFKSGKKGNPLVVAPTGAGKSIIIALFCKTVLDIDHEQKILCLSHIKEILGQDYSAIKKVCETSEIGLYSSGLKSRTIENITVAGIQSIYNKPELFEEFNIIIVDEAHLIPPGNNTMYRKFFASCNKPIIGFTATPFRLGSGYLHLGEDAFFDEIVYDIRIKELQDQNYLCQLTSKGTKKKLDASKIRKQAGDFVTRELSRAFDRSGVTKEIVSELCLYKEVRKKWLIFAIDIEHCEHIKRTLNEYGVKTSCVHSKTYNRDAEIKAFKAGEYQAMVSVGVLTTGFDAPDIDLIALCRPTSSPVLHIQMIGRGLRIHPGKTNCLILDFAGNLMRNGPIDAPVIKVAGKGTGEAVMKECPKCFEIVHAAVRECPVCKFKFQFRHHLSSTSSAESPMAKDQWHKVSSIAYFNKVGKRNIPMLKVRYFCGIRKFDEYICLEHQGFAKHKAKRWWERRAGSEAPISVYEAISRTDELAMPKRIMVNEGGKFPTIKEHEFEEAI